jgi:hypothetical protein
MLNYRGKMPLPQIVLEESINISDRSGSGFESAELVAGQLRMNVGSPVEQNNLFNQDVKSRF